MNKNDLKIVFFGTPEFAVASLKKLLAENFNIAAVVTMPDKIAGRGHHLIQSDVKKFALENNLKILQPVSLKDPVFISELSTIDAQLFIIIAFRMLPEIVWQMPPLGTFNLHASLLPKYRGAAPINWAIINGEKETGVTTFFLKHEIDTGDIIQQERITIADTDNFETVYDRLMNLGANMVLDTVNDIIAGTVKSIPQSIPENGRLPAAPKIFKETGHINWDTPAEDIHNLIRGLSPYPAAWTSVTKGTEEFQLKIFESRHTDRSREAEPCGSIVVCDGKLFVACRDTYLELISVQLSGKKRMPTGDFLRGFSLDGLRFNNPQV